jgi:hypothetical protein
MIQIIKNTITTYTEKGTIWDITTQIKFLGIKIYYSHSITNTFGKEETNKNAVGFQVGTCAPLFINEY